MVTVFRSAVCTVANTAVTHTLRCHQLGSRDPIQAQQQPAVCCPCQRTRPTDLELKSKLRGPRPDADIDPAYTSAHRLRRTWTCAKSKGVKEERSDALNGVQPDLGSNVSGKQPEFLPTRPARASRSAWGCRRTAPSIALASARQRGQPDAGRPAAARR